MPRLRSANLAVLMVSGLALGLGPLHSPIDVSFRLQDGVRISGKMQAFDDDGFEGTFGRRRWSDLKTDDLWRLYRRVMDRRSADQWIALGRVMLLASDGGPRGEQALAEALKIDPAAAGRIEAARQAVSEERRRDEQHQAEQLSTRSPEAGPTPGRAWTAGAWPNLTAEELAAAVAAAKSRTEAILGSGDQITLIESDHFLVSSEGPRADAAELSWQLQQVVRQTAAVLGINEDGILPSGKPLVLVMADRQRFQAALTDHFRQVLPAGSIGSIAYRDASVWIGLHRQAADDSTDLLLRLAARGILHQHRSAARLPAWANEGLAAHVAAQVLPRSAADQARRRAALQHIRRGADLGPVINATYADQAWVQHEPSVTAIGRLVVSLMVREAPQRFAAWVDAVKSGKDWTKALREDFGATPDQLIEAVLSYYRVND